MTVVADLEVGVRARVLSVNGSDEIAMRLLEMGVTPGVELWIVGCAPLGDPLELELRGYRLSVRRNEAERIEVTQQ